MALVLRVVVLIVLRALAAPISVLLQRPRTLIFLLASFLLFWENMNMHEDTPDDLEAMLMRADLKMLAEIVREAESFIAAQLQSGIAADQSAVTFAGVLAAGTAALLAGQLALFDQGASAAIWVLGLVIVAFGVAIIHAFLACRPVDFNYPGNNPKFWKEDIA